MNTKELGIIRRTAEGFRAALADLAGEDGDRKLSSALQAFQEPYDKPLSSQAAGYTPPC